MSCFVPGHSLAFVASGAKETEERDFGFGCARKGLFVCSETTRKRSLRGLHIALSCKGYSLLCLTIGNDSGCAGIPKGFNGGYCLLPFLSGVVGYGNGFGLGGLNR